MCGKGQQDNFQYSNASLFLPTFTDDRRVTITKCLGVNSPEKEDRKCSLLSHCTKPAALQIESIFLQYEINVINDK